MKALGVATAAIAGGGLLFLSLQPSGQSSTPNPYRLSQAVVRKPFIRSAPRVTVRTIATNLGDPWDLAPLAKADFGVVDRAGGRLLRVNGTGTIRVITRRLQEPLGVVNLRGVFYVSNSPNASPGQEIVRVTLQGVRTRIANNVCTWRLSPDGAGNILAPNRCAQTVMKITPTGQITTVFEDPRFRLGGMTDVAAQGSNFILPVGTTNALWRATPPTSLTGIVFGLAPVSVAILGNDYITTDTNGAVYRITPGGAVTSLVTGLSGPKGVIVRGSNIFVVDSGRNGQLLRITP